MQSILKKVVWACLLIIPFVALYVASGHSLDIINIGSSGLYFPFISGKNLLFRFLVGIAFFGWVALALRDPAYRLNIRKSPLLMVYGIFLSVVLVADLLGVDPVSSIWSNFERMEGFVGHIHLFAYFVVLSAMLHTAADYGRMFNYFIASNVAVLAFGFAQLFGWYAIHMSESRLDSTLGNSAYFAIYCLVFAFILALRWSERNFSWEKWWYPLLIILNLVALFYTGTRGTQIGLLVGGFITLGLIAWFEKGKMRKAVAGVMVVTALLVGSVFVFKDTEFIQSSAPLARFASISPNDITGMSRLSIWKISYEAFQERPLLGYGQENFSYIYAGKFLPEKMYNLESWYDRSHDVFFDWLIAAGVVGLLSYLSLYVVALYLMWIRKNYMPLRESAILTGTLAGYFVHNIFVFDNLVSYILFFALLAYIAFRTGTRGEVHGGRAVSEDQLRMLWLPAVGIVFLLVQFYVNYLPLRVNKLLVRGLDVNRLMQTRAFPDVLKVQKESFEKAVALHPLGRTEAREQFLQTAVRMTQVKLEEMPAEDRRAAMSAIKDFIEAARREVETSYEANKNDVRMLSIYGMFYNGIGEGANAEKALSRAHELAPKKQLISFDLIRSYLIQNKFDQAYALAKETYESAPVYADAAKVYMLTAAYAKKWEEARALLLADNQTVSLDGDTLNALVATGQTALAINLLNELKKSNPELTDQIDAYIKQLLAAPKK